MRFRFWATKAEKFKLNEVEKELVDKIARISSLEFAIKESTIRLQILQQEFELEKQKTRSDFAIQKQEILAQHEKELKAKLFESELKEKDLLAATKHKIEQLELKFKSEAETKINEIRTELLKEREKNLQESFDKLSSSMTKLHEEGNAQTKFVQEMAVSLLSQAPKINKLDIGVGQPKNMTEVNLNDNRQDPRKD